MPKSSSQNPSDQSRKLAKNLSQERNLSNDGMRFRLAWFLTRFVLAPALFVYTRLINRTRFFGLENLEKIKGQSYLVCTNHTSSFDIWMGFEIGFASLQNYFSDDYYLCGLGAVDRLGPWIIRKFCIHAGVLPVDRSKGLEQYALQDVVRLFREEKRKIACLIYPEGTRSKSGFLLRDYKAGAGWVQCMTGVPVLPVYQVGYDQLPGIGKRLEIHIGEPLKFEDFFGRRDMPASWISVTDRIMEDLFSKERQFHPRRFELDDHLDLVSRSKPQTIKDCSTSVENKKDLQEIGQSEICEKWQSRHAILVAAKNSQVESLQWADAIHQAGSLAVITKWPNTEPSWLSKLIEQLHENEVPYVLRICHHPLTSLQEEYFARQPRTDLCRFVLFEGYVNPPSFVADITTSIGAVLISHEQAAQWTSVGCTYFILQGDRPGSQWQRSSAQMIELMSDRSRPDLHWGANGILTPLDAIDCLRRGADFIVLDGFSELVCDNAWADSLKSKLLSLLSSKIQLLPDPEYFDINMQSACLILNPVASFKLRKLADCSDQSSHKFLRQLIEDEGYETQKLITFLQDSSNRFNRLLDTIKIELWQRNDCQMILRAYHCLAIDQPSYIKVDPTIQRLLNWYKNFGDELPDTRTLLQSFCAAIHEK